MRLKHEQRFTASSIAAWLFAATKHLDLYFASIDSKSYVLGTRYENEAGTRFKAPLCFCFKIS